MECPHCKQELRLRDPVLHNVRTYGNTARAATLCCGHGVYVSRVISYRIQPMQEPAFKGEDDWGNDIKPLVAVGDLDVGIPNHHDANKRGFNPK